MQLLEDFADDGALIEITVDLYDQAEQPLVNILYSDKNDKA